MNPELNRVEYKKSQDRQCDPDLVHAFKLANVTKW
jgi:hypothetical protein